MIVFGVMFSGVRSIIGGILTVAGSAIVGDVGDGMEVVAVEDEEGGRVAMMSRSRSEPKKRLRWRFS